MTILCRDQDIISFQYVKRAFEFFDHDGNGRITKSDLKRALNPLCFNTKLSKALFEEVSKVLKEDVRLTGISLTQFRNVLLHEMTLKRNRQTQFMEANKSMGMIKECRELARMNVQADAMRNKKLDPLIEERKGDNKKKAILRSIDSLDEMEETLTEKEDESLIEESAIETVQQISEKTEESEHDLDSDFDEYGVRKDPKKDPFALVEELKQTIFLIKPQKGPRRIMIENNFKLIQENLALVRS